MYMYMYMYMYMIHKCYRLFPVTYWPRGLLAVGPRAACREAWGTRTVRATAAAVGPGAACRGA